MQRTAKEIIDDAIKENNAASWILYMFAIIFVVLGGGVLSFGILNQDSLVSILGTVASSMFWPAMSAARKTRRENISIRLLEAPLSQAKTADDAAAMLHQLFERVWADEKKEAKNGYL